MEFNGCMQINKDSYKTLKKKLLRKCEYPTSHVIIVCSPSAQVDPSFMATLLASFDSKVLIQNHWAPTSSFSSLKVWSGALAEYSSKKFCKIAVDSIQKECRSLKVLFFQEIIEILVQAEFYHPKPSKETTKILVKARNPFQPEHFADLTADFCQFGNPKKIQLKKRRTRHGVIAEVEYPSQFMAYATKVAMEGSLYDSLGFLSIDIVVTEAGEYFDKFVKNKFRCIVDDY